jgi:hypothetical protein
MKSRGILIVAGIALLAGFALGWLFFRGKAPDIDNPLVNRLKAERDSLVRLADRYEANVGRWQDSVRVLDGQIASMDSINGLLARRAIFYESQIGNYRGSADDLHRDLNRLIRNAADSARATDPAIGLRR